MTLLRRLLLLSFFFLSTVSVGFALFTRQIVHAQSNTGVNGDKVGPELAFFDPGGQKAVDANVIKPNQYTGVTQVINSIHDAPYNPAPGTRAVIRIVMLHGQKITTEGCNDPNPTSTTIAEVQAYAQALNSSADFPAGTIVMFGNELNNLQKEYCYSLDKGNAAVAREAGQDYARLLKAFAAVLDHGPGKKYLLAPTSIDPNNPEYSGKAFAQGIKDAGGYDVVDVLAQSVFDVPPAPDLANENVTNLTTYQYFERLSGKKVVHFNGWGSHPDLSLREQLDWLLTHQLPPGVEGAATLIVDNCGGKQGNQTSDWFFYILGRIFDKDGTEINPDTCEKGNTKGLRGIYVLPGIEDQPSKDSKLALASKYMLTCAPRFTFSGAIENADRINKSSGNFVAYQLNCSAPGQCEIPNVAGYAYINHEDTTIPLYRFDKAQVPTTTNLTRRLNDLEGYFSARYTTTNNEDPNGILAPGGDAKSLTLDSQCQNTLHYLETIKSLCDKELKDFVPVNNTDGTAAPQPPVSAVEQAATRCALDLTVPGSTQTYLSLLASKPASFSCWNPANTPFKDALAKVETTLPRAFKPAYIVHYVNAPQQNPTTLDKLANWLAPEGTSREEKLQNRIKVTKVYVPAGFASKTGDTAAFPAQGPGTTGDFTYNSGFMSHMLSITTPDTQKFVDEKIKKQQDVILAQSQGGNMLNPNPFNEKYIKCFECEDEDFIASLVRRINSEDARDADADENNLDCSQVDLAGEKALERKSRINPAGNPDPVKEISMPARANLKAGQPEGDKLLLRTYMLLPEEYNRVYEYEKILAGTLFTEDYSNRLLSETSATQPINEEPSSTSARSYKFLQLSDTAPKFGRSGKTVHSSSPEQEGQVIGYNISQSTQQPPPNSTNQEPTTTTTKGSDVKLTGAIRGESEEFDINPTVPGGRLARGLWEIICKAIQPDSGKEPAPYQGLEKLLQARNIKETCFTKKTPPKPDEKPPVCQVDANNISTVSNSSGRPTRVSDGVIALALEVSKYTCTPAEILVGVFSQETGGMNYDPAKTPSEFPILGDPNERVCRTFACVTDPDARGGPYSWYTGLYRNVYAKYGKNSDTCMSNISVNLNGEVKKLTPDNYATNLNPRILGQAMCVTSDYYWMYLTLESKQACDGQPKTMEDIDPDALTHLLYTYCAPGSDIKGTAAYDTYNKMCTDYTRIYMSLINGYKEEVARVRGQLASCTNDSAPVNPAP